MQNEHFFIHHELRSYRSRLDHVVFQMMGQVLVLAIHPAAGLVAAAVDCRFLRFPLTRLDLVPGFVVDRQVPLQLERLVFPETSHHLPFLVVGSVPWGVGQPLHDCFFDRRSNSYFTFNIWLCDFVVDYDTFLKKMLVSLAL